MKAPEAYFIIHRSEQEIKRDTEEKELPQVGRRIEILPREIPGNQRIDKIVAVVKQYYPSVVLCEINTKKENYNTSFIANDFRFGELEYKYVDRTKK